MTPEELDAYEQRARTHQYPAGTVHACQLAAGDERERMRARGMDVCRFCGSIYLLDTAPPCCCAIARGATTDERLNALEARVDALEERLAPLVPVRRVPHPKIPQKVRDALARLRRLGAKADDLQALAEECDDLLDRCEAGDTSLLIEGDPPKLPEGESVDDWARRVANEANAEEGNDCMCCFGPERCPVHHGTWFEE